MPDGSTRRRSAPAKDAAAARPRTEPSARSFRRAEADEVRALVDRLLATGTGRFDSQTALIRALRAELREGEVAQRVGAPRLRAILHEMAGVRVDVRYRVSDGPIRDGPCPVCSAPLRPIYNATLSGGRVVAGQLCDRCGYWRHGRARTPTRYTILRVRPGRTRRPVANSSGA